MVLAVTLLNKMALSLPITACAHCNSFVKKKKCTRQSVLIGENKSYRKGNVSSTNVFFLKHCLLFSVFINRYMYCCRLPAYMSQKHKLCFLFFHLVFTVWTCLTDMHFSRLDRHTEFFCVSAILSQECNDSNGTRKRQNVRNVVRML